jgi:hypothetical protein
MSSQTMAKTQPVELFRQLLRLRTVNPTETKRRPLRSWSSTWRTPASQRKS